VATVTVVAPDGVVVVLHAVAAIARRIALPHRLVRVERHADGAVADGVQFHLEAG